MPNYRDTDKEQYIPYLELAWNFASGVRWRLTTESGDRKNSKAHLPVATFVGAVASIISALLCEVLEPLGYLKLCRIPMEVRQPSVDLKDLQRKLFVEQESISSWVSQRNDSAEAICDEHSRMLRENEGPSR